MARKIWFQLLDDESHHAFAGIAAASVIASNDVKDIEDFRNKVHAKFDRTQSRGSATLAHVASNRLKIYADIEAYDAKEKPLEEDVPIGTFGSSKKNALIVLVPTKRQMQIFWSEPKPSVPDVKRQRSEKLDSRELDMLAALVPQLENGVERMVGKILDIPTRSLNISVPYGLYIRQEYWDLYVIIKQQLRTNRLLRRFLVLGTSGVGKSVFGVFLLLVFLTERKNVAYRGRDDKLIYFTWDIFGYKCSQTPYAGCNYDGLFDGKGTGEALQLRKFNCAFLFADSCPQSYNEFAKTLCFEAYMEPWTKIECDMFADAINLNGKDDWLRTVNLVGGKPSVMVQSRHESEYLVHHVEASTPKNLEDDKYEVQPRKQNRIDNWTDSDSFYLYRNENASSRAYPATFFAVETIMKGHFNNYSNKIRDLMRAQASIDQSWRGNELLHELTASKFCMKSLEGNGVGTVTQHGPLNAAFEAIEASFEIRNELMLYISMSNYFPATIDGVLVIPQDGRIMYVQWTTSKILSIDCQLLKNLYQELAQRQDIHTSFSSSSQTNSTTILLFNPAKMRMG